MQKILIEIKKDCLTFCCLIKTPQNKQNLLNTNVISNNELLFSLEYILNNKRLVSLFIKEICEDKKITKIEINNMKYVDIVCQLVSKSNITKVTITDEINFTYKAYESIIKIPTIKYVDCFTIPTFMIELFDKKDIKVESRQEVLFSSKFMEENNLNQYSKLYYKSSIRIPDSLNNNDIIDLESFLKINKYLKKIHFTTNDLNDINQTISTIIKYKRRNIKIEIHNNITDSKIIDELKKLNKKLKIYNIKIKLTYSKEYIKDNYLKQIIITTLSYCMIGIIIIVLMCLGYVVINSYQSKEKVDEINNDIQEKISSIDSTEDTTESTEDTTSEETTTKTNNNLKITNRVLSSLKEMNEDTVGWLTVPETNIDYPVVQATDNDYYLTHNFYKEEDKNGWLFMNYLNNSEDLDRNTIIFGHNRYYNGVMFGTLSKVNKETWYNNAENNLITFNTLYGQMKWQVFSIYIIDVTDDYLKTKFTDDEWTEFITMIRSRSVFQSNIEINNDDKIITLSTCMDNEKRLVVHAVLVK